MFFIKMCVCYTMILMIFFAKVRIYVEKAKKGKFLLIFFDLLIKSLIKNM